MGRGHLRRMAKMERVHGILVEKCQGSRPLGRHNHRWQDNSTGCAWGPLAGFLEQVIDLSFPRCVLFDGGMGTA